MNLIFSNSNVLVQAQMGSIKPDLDPQEMSVRA